MKRLTPATLTFGVMAIMGLLVSAYVVRTLLARDEKPPEVKTRNMPTPVADIPVGTVITEKHLGSAPTLISTLTPDMLASNSVIVGRVVREPLKKAVPIKANQLYGPGERPPLKLAAGMQAMTLSLNSMTAIVDGLIKPGDHCDILFTINNALYRDDRIPFGYQVTLFKGVKILAINRSTVQQNPEGNGNTVTLQVRPGQARALRLAEQTGMLTLVYTTSSKPGGLEISDADDDRLTIEKMLKLPPKPEAPQPPRPPEPYTIDQYRRLSRATISFLPNGRIWDGWNGYGAYGNATPWGGIYGGYGGYNSLPVNPSVPNSNLPNPNLPNQAIPGGPPDPGSVGPQPPSPVTPGTPNSGAGPNNGVNAPQPNPAAPGPTAVNTYPLNVRGR